MNELDKPQIIKAESAQKQTRENQDQGPSKTGTGFLAPSDNVQSATFPPPEPTTKPKAGGVKWFLIALGVCIILLLTFQLGVFVGFRKASFTFKWADSYQRNFGGPKGGFFREFTGQNLINGHGMAGIIAKIDGNNIVIQDRDGMEKLITTSGQTSIKEGSADLRTSQLKVGDLIVVIGTPNDNGFIEAKIIRVFGLPHSQPNFYNFNQ